MTLFAILLGALGVLGGFAMSSAPLLLLGFWTCLVAFSLMFKRDYDTNQREANRPLLGNTRVGYDDEWKDAA